MRRPVVIAVSEIDVPFPLQYLTYTTNRSSLAFYQFSQIFDAPRDILVYLVIHTEQYVKD